MHGNQSQSVSVIAVSANLAAGAGRLLSWAGGLARIAWLRRMGCPTKKWRWRARGSMGPLRDSEGIWHRLSCRAERGAASGRNQKCLLKKQDVAPLQRSRDIWLRIGRGAPSRPDLSARPSALVEMTEKGQESFRTVSTADSVLGRPPLCRTPGAWATKNLSVISGNGCASSYNRRPDGPGGDGTARNVRPRRNIAQFP